jgi:hypothetical protein
MRNVLGVILLLVVGSANAATVVYSSPGIATGIAGLNIGGTLYNVDFEAPGDAYSTFGGTELFWADLAESNIARDAINTVLDANAVVDLNNEATYAKPLFFVRNQALIEGSFSHNYNPTTWTGSINSSVPEGHSLIEGYATAWSVVPIPAAVWLFGSALAGLGWMRRKQTV